MTPPPHLDLRHWRALAPGLQVAVIAAAVCALGAGAALVRPDDSPVALWWPGAGVAVVGLLVVEARRRPQLLVALVGAGIVGNLAGGQPLAVAAAYAVGNALEPLVVWAVLSHRRAEARRLSTVGDLMRLLLGVLAGALVAGATIATAATVLVDAPWAQTATAIAASHGSAVLLLVPLGMRTTPAPTEAGRLELVLQWSLVAGVAVAVFAPDRVLPLAFLVPPSLLWGALRSSVRAAALQLLTVGVVATGLTLWGGGPFAAADRTADGRTGALTLLLLQLLVVCSAVVMLAVAVTVSQRRAVLLDVSRREELFRVGFTESLLGLLLLRAEPEDLRIVELNGVAARLLGGTATELIGTPWHRALAPEDRDRVREAVASLGGAGPSGWHGEVAVEADGVARWCEVAISPAVAGTVAGDLLTVQMVDVTARRAAEARLSQLALRDGLTGLANRILLDDRIERALGDARRTGRSVGVLFLDLDGFKQVNDTHGHGVGDELLAALGRRIAGAVRDIDTVARIGGDEFVVVCPSIVDRQAVDHIIVRIRRALQAPVEVDGLVLRSDASIGVTIGDGDSDPRELLRRADIAMYAQKGERRAARPEGSDEVALPPV